MVGETTHSCLHVFYKLRGVPFSRCAYFSPLWFNGLQEPCMNIGHLERRGLRMKSPSKAALVFTVLAIVSCAPAADEAVVEETPTTEADVAAAHRLRGAWTAAYNASDADAVAALYADDAILMSEGTPARIGKSAIRDSYVQAFELGTYTSEDVIDELIVSQDWIIARGNWAEEFVPQDGSEPVQEVGKSMWLSQRQPDGSWKIKWQIWNRDAPVRQQAVDGRSGS